MKGIDLYDILISEMGFPMAGIDDVLINLHEDELLELKNEIGILPGKVMFNLILKDDNEHCQDTVVFDLFPFFGEKSESLMMEAHTNGAVILQVAEYKQLKKIQVELKQKNYNIIINRIEPNEEKCGSIL